MAKKEISAIMIFKNGNIAVCDAAGNQIPELQGNLITSLWCEVAVKLGFDIEGCEINLMDGAKMRIIKTSNGFNIEAI